MSSQPGYNSLSYRRIAVAIYQSYLEVQAKISFIENEAMEAAQNNSRAAAIVLLNRPDTESGYIYLSLCKERGHLMRRADLAATMAMMLEMVQ